MTDAIRPLIAGNWKMNGLKASSAEFEAMLAGAPGVAAKADLLVCPPATLIAAFAEKARGSKTFAIGAQDCHPKASGAHTGDLSAEMLADAGASAIIIGHSERRTLFGETDASVNRKLAVKHAHEFHEKAVALITSLPKAREVRLTDPKLRALIGSMMNRIGTS